jgi:LuxR family transcriptional regulator, maltose regulon positive regulatory protein
MAAQARSRTNGAVAPARRSEPAFSARDTITAAGPRPPHPGSPDLVLLHTKVRPPVLYDRMIRRPRLEAVLDASIHARLSLVSGSAGFGKTALVSTWCADDEPGRRVAWVTLDDGDNDPFRFWSYVIEALRQVDPELAHSLRRHKAAASEQLLTEIVLPQLLNALDVIDFDVVLVLDDIQVISDPVCHRTLEYTFDHLPPHVHLCLLARADPPLPLARLRVRAELVEIRSADLAFTQVETDELLNQGMALGLTESQVERLWRLTEGWPAALHLAGLSMRSGSDADEVIASFAHGHPHVFDYLGSEVLRQLPAHERDFLTQTSILTEFSASLCDAVRARTDSASMIAELEKDNLYLVPLDGRREWFRYRHLFAALLRLELQATAPDTVQELHRSAARWFARTGDADKAIHHSIEARDHERAKHLIIRHWLTYERSGQAATVERWLAALTEEAIEANSSLAVIAAWVGGKRGASQRRVHRWLAVAEAVGVEGAEVPGSFPVPFAVPLTRAINCFGDVGATVVAARAALAALRDTDAAEWRVIAAVTLGRCLYLSGSADEAHQVLTRVAQHLPSAGEQPQSAVNVWALLSLLDDESGERELAAEQARRAFAVAEDHGLRFDPLSGVAHLALARAVRRAGHLAEAETILHELVAILQHDSYAVARGEAELELALVQHTCGQNEPARGSLRRAHEIIRSCEDPGRLSARFSEVSAALQRPARPEPVHGDALTHGEIRVLRLLDTPLSQGQIADELHVSVNTVRTHVRAVYRKLGVTSRQEAVSGLRTERQRSDGSRITQP